MSTSLVLLLFEQLQEDKYIPSVILYSRIFHALKQSHYFGSDRELLRKESDKYSIFLKKNRPAGEVILWRL